MKYLLSIIFIIFTINTYSAECRLTTFSKVYIAHDIRNHLKTSDLIQESNCNDNIKAQFTTIIEGIEGNIHTGQITAELKDKFKVNVLIQPTRLSIFTLEKFISEKIFQERDKKVISISNLSKKILSLKQSENLSISCNDCNKTGESLVNASITNPLANNKNKIFWLKIKVATLTKTYKAKENMNLFTSRTGQDFDKEYIYTDRPFKYFTKINELPFYKLNKSISKGSPLLTRDLTPLPLIKPGAIVKVRMENDKLKLSMFATARGTGYYKKTIELYNNHSQKRIQGIVTNYNEVLISL